MAGYLAVMWDSSVTITIFLVLCCARDSSTADILAVSTAIYFDGYLPEYKRAERLSRIRQTSVVAHNYFLATSAGIPSANMAVPSSGRSENLSLSTLTTKRRLHTLPVPGFLVPAVLDSLRSSRYGPLTRLVPGEADPFCAQAVRQIGGIVLTSDSDLLLYNLGSDGGVVFLNDINISEFFMCAPTQGVPEVAAQTRSISALVHDQQSILKKISPRSSLPDLLKYSYGLTMGSYSSLAEWSAQTKTQPSYTDHDDDDYQRFLAPYKEIPGLFISGLGCEKFLDPRIAEFVLSVGDNVRIDSLYLDSLSQRAPIFYLPQLLDRWDLGSAWITGRHIRELAYSICCPVSKDDQSVVVEYRRTLSESPQGLDVHLSSDERTVRSLEDTLSYILKFVAGPFPYPGNLNWIALCLSLEISDAAQEGKASVASKAWKKAAKACYRLDPGDWDAIHLAANIQGTLYSLRILQQVLKCSQAGLVQQGLEGIGKTDVEKMLRHFTSLPPLAEYPRAVDMADLFKELVVSGLSAIIELYTGFSQPFPPQNKISAKDKKQNQQKQKKLERGTTRFTSANPFDFLDAD